MKYSDCFVNFIAKKNLYKMYFGVKIKSKEEIFPLKYSIYFYAI